MNNSQLYLAWLRTYAPTVYAQAVRKATGQPRTTGGLTDDLVTQALSPNVRHSFLGDELDPITVTGQAMNYAPITTDFSPPDLSSSFDPGSLSMPSMVSVDTGPSAVAPSSSGGGWSVGSTFANILSSVATIGAGVLNYSNQNKLISLNTTRAQQGLPPVNANGQVVSPYSTSSTSPGLLAFERSITGGTGSLMLPILAVLGIGAFFMLRKKSAA